MAFSLSSVLSELGIEIEEVGMVSRTPGITCLGTISSLYDDTVRCPLPIGSFVWHAEAGWAAIDRMEMERWMVDAPAGNHWMISERKLVELNRLPSREGVVLTLWSSETLSAWLGRAVLEGKLHLSCSHVAATSTFTSIQDRAESLSTPEPKAIALKPSVNLTDWLRDMGYESLPVKPLLLEGRRWDVCGELVGPEDTRESHSWSLLDDPFLNSLSPAEDAQELPFVPQLERLQPPFWRSQGTIRSELTTVCEERRHWRVNQTSADGLVQGSILHWWRIDEKTAEMTHSPVLIPAWQVEFPDSGAMVVHGLCGKLVNLPKL